MDSEQSQNFNERLSQWIGNQGFWFQIRYSMAGGGKSRALVQLLQLGFRAGILLLIAALGTWIYLVKRSDTEGFRRTLHDDLRAGLSAKELEIKGAARLQGQLEISRLAAVGGPETFFTALEARSVHCRMGLLDGVMGIWKPGMVSIAKLEMDLRAGADDAQSARQLSQALFRRFGSIDFQGFEVAEATVHWGYSERTQGTIESSNLKAQRTERGWRLSFKGGWFYQNWLRKLEIVNLIVDCDPDGLVFERAELRQGKGSVDFSGLRIVGGERPKVSGTAQIQNLSLNANLPPSFLNTVEGSISGEFTVFGSTNSSEGIGLEGDVVLDGRDSITLRQQIYLLKALSVVDYSRKYHRVDFHEGSFHLKTSHGGMILRDLKLKAEDFFTMSGELTVRLPTAEEIRLAESKDAILETSPLFSGESAVGAGRDANKAETSFSLKRAAQEARRLKESNHGESDTGSLFDRLSFDIEMRRLQSDAVERQSRMLHYEGVFQITLPGDAFEQAPMLRSRYPADAKTGRITMSVPILGNYNELTLKQAEEIYLQGQRKH